MTVFVCWTVTVRTASRSVGVTVIGPPGTVRPVGDLEGVVASVVNFECAPSSSV